MTETIRGWHWFKPKNPEGHKPRAPPWPKPLKELGGTVMELRRNGSGSPKRDSIDQLEALLRYAAGGQARIMAVESLVSIMDQKDDEAGRVAGILTEQLECSEQNLGVRLEILHRIGPMGIWSASSGRSPQWATICKRIAQSVLKVLQPDGSGFHLMATHRLTLWAEDGSMDTRMFRKAHRLISSYDRLPKPKSVVSRNDMKNAISRMQHLDRRFRYIERADAADIQDIPDLEFQLVNASSFREREEAIDRLADIAGFLREPTARCILAEQLGSMDQEPRVRMRILGAFKTLLPVWVENSFDIEASVVFRVVLKALRTDPDSGIRLHAAELLASWAMEKWLDIYTFREMRGIVSEYCKETELETGEWARLERCLKDILEKIRAYH